MKVAFSLALDGYDTLLPRQMLSTPTCGPLGFLQLLETRLGLKAKATSSPRRVVQFRQILEQITNERSTFYSESFKRDPYAVAETLLNWRDDLIEAGWDGLAAADDTIRIQDLAAVEARAFSKSPDDIHEVNIRVNTATCFGPPHVPANTFHFYLHTI